MKCLKCLTYLEQNHAHYGLHTECFTSWFKVSEKVDFNSLTRRSSRSSDRSADSSHQNTSFFHGKFKKYSAELEGSSYILKMREDEAPELPEVEYLCNQIGKMLDIPVAEFYMVDFEGDKVFVTKNFMRTSTPTDLQHIYHFRPDDQHTCETLINVITEKTRRPYDVNLLINTILFDSLIGNHDRHGRNLGLIVISGDTSLSPIYDNVSYLGLEKGNMLKADFNPTGKICTKITADPSMKDYVIEFNRLGYQENVTEFYHKIKFKHLEKLIHESFCSTLMKEAVTRLIAKRYKELEGELNG